MTNVKKLSARERLTRWLTTGWTLTSVVMWVTGAFIGIILLFFFVAGVYAFRTDAVEAASRMSYWRDLVSIVISVQIIVIVVAIGIVIVQVGRFVNLLRSEVKPITEDVKQTVNSARNTTEFVGKNAAEPIIKSVSFFTGFFTLLREIVQLGRVLKQQNKNAPKSSDEPPTSA